LIRKHVLVAVMAAGAAVLATGIVAGPDAFASHGGGRPCGDPVVAPPGNGTLGTGFTLKSMYDDDGPVPGVVVGEEFEINTEAAGQQWTVTLADHGTAFFSGTVVSDPTGINVTKMTPAQPGGQVMTADARNLGNGETIHGSVTLNPPPPTCGAGGH
jgi:hypothetical protein